MKKLTAIFLSLTLMIAFTACGESHKWIEATCTEPMVCSECNETQGEALGHTTDFGVCERCNAEIDEMDLIHRMSDSTEIISEYVQSAANYCMSGEDDAVDGACYYLGLAKEEIENFISICHEHEKAAYVAEPFEEVLDAIPTEVYISSSDEFYEFLDDISLILEASGDTVDLCLEMTENVFNIEP